MDKKTLGIQDKILLKALEDVPFDGWQWPVIQAAAEKAGYGRDMADAVFPEKLSGVLCHFADWADRQMLEQLESLDSSKMRIRDRVRTGVEKRIEILGPHKESVKAALAYWIRPFRKIDAGKMLWRTADRIWVWAGDESKDYSHYTKRALLSGVISTTMLAWINDNSDNSQETLDFLDRRIDNVLNIGKLVGGLKGKRKPA